MVLVSMVEEEACDLQILPFVYRRRGSLDPEAPAEPFLAAGLFRLVLPCSLVQAPRQVGHLLRLLLVETLSLQVSFRNRLL